MTYAVVSAKLPPPFFGNAEEPSSPHAEGGQFCREGVDLWQISRSRQKVQTKKLGPGTALIVDVLAKLFFDGLRTLAPRSQWRHAVSSG